MIRSTQDSTWAGTLVAAVPGLWQHLPLTGNFRAGHVRVLRVNPGHVAESLQNHRAGAALLGPVGLSELDRAFILPAGCIATGPRTHAVRVVSRVDSSRLTRLHCSPGLGAQALLAAVVLGEELGQVPLLACGDEPSEPDVEAMVLPGYQTPRLGEDFDRSWNIDRLWHEQTALPGPLWLWACRADDAPYPQWLSLLRRGRCETPADLARAIRASGTPRGVSVERAVDALCAHWPYEWTDAHGEGLAELFERGCRAGLLENVPDWQVV